MNPSLSIERISMRFVFLGVAALSALAGCATPLAPDLPLSDALREKAASLGPGGKPAGSDGSAEAVIHLRAAGNFGVIWTYSLAQRFGEHTDGLVEDLTIVRRIAAADLPPTSTRTLAICGLITLKSESSSGTAQGKLVFFPAGGSVAAVPVGTSLPTSNREVATTLQVESNSICAPTAGGTFAYRLTGKWERSVAGPVGTMRFVNEFVEVTTCNAETLAPEHQYLNALGATLALRCSHKSIGGRPTSSVFAYLPDARRYLLVYLGYGESTYNRIEYKSFNYKP